MYAYLCINTPAYVYFLCINTSAYVYFLNVLSLPFLSSPLFVGCASNSNFSALSALMAQKAKPRERLHSHLSETR